MRILLTGSHGFIGSRLKIELEKLSHEVIVDRIFTVIPNIDIVYHLAAQTDVQWSISHPLEDARTNIMLTLEILKNYPNAKIIYPGSACGIEAKSPYGLSKRTAVDYIKLIAKDYVICSLSNIWGPGGHGVINIFQNSDVCTIYGDGEQTRTITHVDDVVRALVYAMNWPKGDYWVGGETISVNEIAKRIGKPVIYKEKKDGEIYNSVISNTTPDWQPEIKL